MSNTPETNHFNRRNSLSPQEEKWKNIAFWFCIIFFILFIGELILYLLIWNINDWACVFLLQILLIMPAYLANAGMLIFGKGGKPLDKGKTARDGNRLLGPGKTVKGLILGPLFGILVSLCIHGILIITWNGIESIIIGFWSGGREYILFKSTVSEAVDLFKVYMTGARLYDSLGIGLLKLCIRVTLVSFSAAGGDLFGSWLKRRMNKNRGEPVWILDQLDFIIPALLVSMPFIILDRNFIAIFIFIVIFTPFMAIVSNTVAYLTGLKNVPY
jgi:CDP-2,3-bis-(O-geranylgeranyl)-sn-glycerol synthase